MKELSASAFDLLVAIEANKALSTDADFSELEQAGYIEKGTEITVTEKGYAYLEPHRVKRAILLAAGFGSRLRPVTDETPKPLVKVHGKPIIETVIDALIEKEINEIIVVTGYKQEQFAALEQKYPQVRCVFNDRFEKDNNISSAMVTRQYFANAYIMEADLFLVNRDLIRKYEYATGYLGIPVEQSDDWCFIMDGDRIADWHQKAENAYQEVGICYWNAEDAKQFQEDIVKLYATEEGKQMFWDAVALVAFKEHYNMRVRPCHFEDIVEIDTVQDLVSMDDSYAPYLAKTSL